MTNAPDKPANGLHIEPDVEDLLRAHRLITVDAFFDDAHLSSIGAIRLDKPGLSTWRSRFRLPPPADHADPSDTLYIKRFDHPPKNALREIKRARNGARSGAGVEWAWIHFLIRDVIPCPAPAALGEQFDAGRERRSVLITRRVPGQSLERWLSDWSDRDRATIRALLYPLADMIARFHRQGYVHRDLYMAHIFFDPEGTAQHRCLEGCRGKGQAGSLCLIDLQRVLRPILNPHRFVVKDLAALNYSATAPLVSHADRLRWLKRYLGIGRLDPTSRRLVYRIVGKTQQIARHDARRRARLTQRNHGR